MAFLTKFSWPSFRRVRSAEDGLPSAPPQQPAPKKQRIGGPFTTGVPCNPEIGVGLLAAVVEPASAYLRVANKPVRRGVMAVNTELCCNGACGTVYCCGTRRTTFRLNESCRFCCKILAGAGTIYMLMGMAFCKPECRIDYYIEEVYNPEEP